MTVVATLFKPSLSSGHEVGNAQEMPLEFCFEDTGEMDSISPPFSLRILPLPAVTLVGSVFSTKERIIIIQENRESEENHKENKQE